MPEFNGINPDKSRGLSFNQNRAGKNTPQNTPSTPESAPSSETPINQIEPDRLFELLSTQAQQNIPLGMESIGIEKSVITFSGFVSPERHKQVSNSMKQTFIKEFGHAPSDNLLQNMVDDYLIGQVSIQGA